MIINKGFGMLGYALTSIVTIIMVLGWIVLAIVCLCQLRNKTLPSIAKAIWALIIAAVPWLGAIAFLIIKPQEIE